MPLKKKHLTRGFVLAGLANMQVFIFSKGFTSPTISEFDPVVMSNFGLLMIIIWGLAYMAVAKSYPQVKWLVGVFALEKLIYGVIWIHWILNHSLSTVYEKDLLAGLFYSVYGVNDWLFFAFFSFVFIRLNTKK